MNSNYVPHTGAPRFIASVYSLEIGHALDAVVTGDAALLAEYASTAEQIAMEQNAMSPCALEANTLSIWNDGIIFHARGAAQDSDVQKGRLVETLSVNADLAGVRNEAERGHAAAVSYITAPVASPTIGPKARIDLSSRPEWEAALPPNMRGGRS